MKRWHRVTIAVGVLAATSLLFPVVRYLLRAAFEEGRILARRRSIAELVAVPPQTARDSATRAKLALVLEARSFARDSLALDTKESFTQYSDLGRDTLVLVLSVAYRDSLAYRRFWFPVVGWVPYKGYFDPVQGRAADAAFRAQGFDTRLRPSDAFSTLGWFNDPLLSTTLRADSVDLVDTVIHELLHNTLFVPSEVDFNESFASFVGARGAERFFRARGDTAHARQAADRWHNDVLLARFWGRTARQIGAAFAALPGDSLRGARLARRDTIYAAASRFLRDSIWPSLRDVAPFPARGIHIDNASLLARRTYATDLEQFDAVLRAAGGDVKATVAQVRATVAEHPKAPFAAVRALAVAAGARDSLPATPSVPPAPRARPRSD